MKELENQGYEKDEAGNEAGCYQGTVYTVREVPGRRKKIVNYKLAIFT